MNREEKRTDEAQVYDVHSFIQRYMGALKEQNIPINKKQIGVLEQMLLAENPVPVGPSIKKEYSLVLDSHLDKALLKSLSPAEYPVDRLISLISGYAFHEGSCKGNYSELGRNSDALQVYEKSVATAGEVHLIQYGYRPSRFNKKVYDLLETYLQQKGLLPPEQK